MIFTSAYKFLNYTRKAQTLWGCQSLFLTSSGKHLNYLPSPIDTTSRYRYDFLTGRRSFRVIELLPADGVSKSLVISLKIASLEDPPNFEALSYAWEAQSRDQSIICDGQQLKITATCKAALYRLRLKSTGRLLWIDGICIDQGSDKDKQHQILLMGDI